MHCGHRPKATQRVKMKAIIIIAVVGFIMVATVATILKYAQIALDAIDEFLNPR